MKKLILLAILLSMMVGCKDKDDDKKVMFDETHPIWINGVENLNKSYEYGQMLTAYDIVRLPKNGTHINLLGFVEGTRMVYGTYALEYEEGTIDTINNRLAMQSINISFIDNNPFFDPSIDWVITAKRDYGWDVYYDTIAYIPRAQRLRARDEITELWDKVDFEKIYEIFDNAFSFIPCTSQSYKEAKARGEN